MLKALKVMEDSDPDSWDFKTFSEQTQNINIEREEKELIKNI